MAFQPAPACAQVTLRFVRTANGEFIGANTLVLNKPSGTAFDQADVEAAADEVFTWWGANYQDIVGTAASLESITVRGLASPEDVIHVLTPLDAGLQVGDLLPSNVTFAVSFRTGLTGRSARGRVYMCGMVESQVAGNTVTAPYAAACVSTWQAFQTAMNAAGFDHVVLSRVTGGVPRVNALPRKVTTVNFTDLRSDSMRDRLG